MQVVPQKLTELARECLAASQAVSDRWSGAQGWLQVDGDAAGNSPGGARLVVRHATAANAADVAVGRLAAVLEQDMDSLYQCAFDFSTTDEKEAATYESSLLALPGLF